MLLILAVEFLDHLICQIERVAMVKDDFQRAFAALIDDECESALFRHRFRGDADLFHVLVH